MSTFKITGPGKYKTRDGHTVTLRGPDSFYGFFGRKYPWLGKYGRQPWECSWTTGGVWDHTKGETGRDIVAKVVPPKRKRVKK